MPRVEGRSARQVRGAVGQGVAVLVGGGDGEREGRRLVHREGADGVEDGRGVDVVDGDADRLGVGVDAVADREDDVGVGALLVVAGRPGEGPVLRVEGGPGGEVRRLVGQGVAVTVAGRDRERERRPLGPGPVADRTEDGRLVHRLGEPDLVVDAVHRLVDDDGARLEPLDHRVPSRGGGVEEEGGAGRSALGELDVGDLAGGGDVGDLQPARRQVEGV